MKISKGVICAIGEDEDMAVDASGNRADIHCDDRSTIARMNLSRLYEQYFHASARVTAMRISDMLSAQVPLDTVWDYAYAFYAILSPRMLPLLPTDANERMVHLREVAVNGFHVWLPCDNPVWYPAAVQELRARYPAPYAPITYRGASGNMVTTHNPVLIGGMYMMLLEKTGHDWAAVSSAKLNHFGIPAKITNADKYAKPIRLQPTRITGESEIRMIAAYCGGRVAAELLDQANSPAVHRYGVNNILTAANPSNIIEFINHDIAPFGNGRVNVFVKHMGEAGGYEYVNGAAA